MQTAPAVLKLTPEGGKPMTLTVEEVPGQPTVRVLLGVLVLGYAPALCARQFARGQLRVSGNALGMEATARADGYVFRTDELEGE